MLELEAFWDRKLKVWVLIVLDQCGNQVWDADYFPNSAALRWALDYA